MQNWCARYTTYYRMRLIVCVDSKWHCRCWIAFDNTTRADNKSFICRTNYIATQSFERRWYYNKYLYCAFIGRVIRINETNVLRKTHKLVMILISGGQIIHIIYGACKAVMCVSIVILIIRSMAENGFIFLDSIRASLRLSSTFSGDCEVSEWHECYCSLVSMPIKFQEFLSMLRIITSISPCRLTYKLYWFHWIIHHTQNIQIY